MCNDLSVEYAFKQNDASTCNGLRACVNGLESGLVHSATAYINFGRY